MSLDDNLVLYQLLSQQKRLMKSSFQMHLRMTKRMVPQAENVWFRPYVSTDHRVIG